MLKRIIFLHFCFLIILRSTTAQTAYHIPVFTNKNNLKNTYLSFTDSSTKNTNGFNFGASLGFYFANKNTAQYYNGANENNIDSVLNYPYNYAAIKEKLNYDFKLSELPAKMRYNPSLLLGMYAKYSIKNWGLFTNFSMSKLKTKDIFTIEIFDPGNTLSEKIYRQEVVFGSEQRTNIDFGITYLVPSESKNKAYFELGYNINDTKFINNKINIEGLEYSIAKSYYDVYKIERGGIGMGFFAGGGIEINFNDYITLNPGFNLYYVKIKLGSFDEFKLNSSIYVRLILNSLL